MCNLFEGKWSESDKIELLNEPKQTKEAKQIHGKLQWKPFSVFQLPLRQCTLFAPQILHELLLWNALGNMQTSQENFTTIVYAKFGRQTACIMGNWKVENADIHVPVSCDMIFATPHSNWNGKLLLRTQHVTPFHSDNVQQNRLKPKFKKRDWWMYKGLSSDDISDNQKQWIYIDMLCHLHVQLSLLRNELRLDLREQGKLSLKFAQCASL